MKNKFVTVLLASMLVLSLVGCGGKKEEEPVAQTEVETKTSTPDVEATEESVEETKEVTNTDDPFAELSQYLQCGYAGATDDDARVLWAVDNELTYGLMVLEDETETVTVYGSIDKNDDGTITVNNEQGGSINLTVLQGDDGSYTLTMEDGSVAVVYDTPVEDIIAEFKNISEGNSTFEADDSTVDTSDEIDESTADASDETDPFEQLKSVLDCGYAGACDDGSKMLWTVDSDFTKGIMVVESADGSDVQAIAGGIESNSDGTFTMTDYNSGDSITMSAETTTDDDGTECYLLTTADGSQALVYEVPASDVIDAYSQYAE